VHIKTFGDVDARSLEQLKRCMEAGEAEYGVLCADHHQRKLAALASSQLARSGRVTTT